MAKAYNTNVVVLDGNLAKDPQTRSAGSKTVCSFTVAVNQGEDVSFIDCEAWEKLGENVSKYCKKGSGVIVTGRIKQGSYDTDSGKRYFVKVVANSVRFIGGRQEQSDPGAYQDDIF